MTEEEFAPWLETARVTYAKAKESEGLSPADAAEVSAESFRKLLPNGVSSPDQYLYQVVEKATGAVRGHLWWAKTKQGSREIAWVYDISLHEACRGRGWGRATMFLAEEEVKRAGIQRFGLHVFGYNQVARGLYASLGFSESNIVMYKDLPQAGVAAGSIPS